MPQLRLQVSEKMICQLPEFRKHHPHPRVRQKIDAVLMHALDFAQDDIARFLGVTEHNCTVIYARICRRRARCPTPV